MQNLEFILRPSSVYLFLTSLFFLVTLGIVLFLPISPILKLFLFILVFTYSIYILWRFGLLRSRLSIVGIKRLSDGRWLLKTPVDEIVAELCPFSTVTSVVSVLRFKVPKQRMSKICIIFWDSLEREHFRQLLVVLKMY